MRKLQSIWNFFFLCIFSLIVSLVLFFSRRLKREYLSRQYFRSLRELHSNISLVCSLHFIQWIWQPGFGWRNSRRGVSTVYEFDLYQVVVISATSAFGNKIYVFVMTIIVWSGSSMQSVLIFTIINIEICSSSNTIVNIWASNTVILN